MSPLDQLTDELLAEACDDEVGLWLIITKVRDDLLVQDPEKRKQLTFEIVRRMLESGRVEAGYYKPDGSGIARWSMPIADVLLNIDAGWTRLGREPSIGEVVLLIGK